MSSPPSLKGLLKSFLEYAQDNLVPYVTLLGGVILGISGNHIPWPLPNDFNEYRKDVFKLFYLGLALALFAIFLEESRKTSVRELQHQISNLQNERDELDSLIDGSEDDYTVLAERWLRVFLKGQGHHENGNVRASIYGSVEGRAFYLMGRYCDNLKWCQVGRATYKADGIIGKAFSDNTAYASYPNDPLENGVKTADYLNWQCKDGCLTNPDAQALRMPSRHYAAVLLRENGKKSMVVVVESAEAENRFGQGYYETPLVKEKLACLTDKLIRYKLKAPAPQMAESEGF